MYFEDSEFQSKLTYYKFETNFGSFFFLENFIITELKYGIHYKWEMIELLMDEIISFYGKDAKIGYIANRVNSFSVNPNFWNKLDENYDLISATAIVSYSKIAKINATIEKKLFKKSLKLCTSLGEAINWVKKLKELN